MFPSDIPGLYAKSVAVQEQPNADFLISLTPLSLMDKAKASPLFTKNRPDVLFGRSPLGPGHHQLLRELRCSCPRLLLASP
jgi:hypothetical protein